MKKNFIQLITNTDFWKSPFLVMAFRSIKSNVFHAIKIQLLVSTLIVLIVKTINYVIFNLMQVKNVIFKDQKLIQTQEIINLIIKWRLFSNLKSITIKNMNVLHAKFKLLRIATCVKIVTTFSFVKNVLTKKKNSRVFMPTIIKSITFIRRYFDIIDFHFYESKK